MIKMKTRRGISKGLAVLGLLSLGYLSRPTIDNVRDYARPRIAYVHQQIGDFMDPVGAYIRSNEFVPKDGTRTEMANWASSYAMAQGPENSSYPFWEDVILRATEKRIGKQEPTETDDIRKKSTWYVPKEMEDMGITRTAGNINPGRVLDNTNL